MAENDYVLPVKYGPDLWRAKHEKTHGTTEKVRAMAEEKRTLKKELESLLNRYSTENKSNTPDFILAGHLIDCLELWEKTVQLRDDWYGLKLKPGHDYHD